MKDVNKVILMGRLGSNPIQRETKKGLPVVHFPLATSRRLKAQEGGSDAQPQEETQWHQVVVWGKQGVACAQFLKKGDKAMIDGMIRSHSYSGKDGQKRYSFEVHAEEVIFVETRRSRRSDSQSDRAPEEIPEQEVGSVTIQ